MRKTLCGFVPLVKVRPLPDYISAISEANVSSK